MIIPPYLQKGDQIGIVSTARKLTKQEIQPALKLLDAWGFKARLGKSIGASDDQFAGSDQLRARDLQQMLDDPQIKAIWCARGGYGTVRIIDRLNFTAFSRQPKWIVGYSDITVLHAHLNGRGVATLHAQMPLEIEKRSPESARSIEKALKGHIPPISYDTPSGDYRLGHAMGTLVGGNLSVLYSLCGSPSALRTEGKVLFLEDLDEYLYHVDRMIQNLKRNGMLENLAGLVVGGMTQMNDNTIPFGRSAEEIIWEAVREYDYPVSFGFPAGHIEDNRALLMGGDVVLEVSESSVQLTFH